MEDYSALIQLNIEFFNKYLSEHPEVLEQLAEHTRQKEIARLQTKQIEIQEQLQRLQGE